MRLLTPVLLCYHKWFQTTNSSSSERGAKQLSIMASVMSSSFAGSHLGFLSLSIKTARTP